jgi:hypothetical protein
VWSNQASDNLVLPNLLPAPTTLYLDGSVKIDIAAGFNISGTALDLGSVSMMRGDDALAVTCVAPLLHLF